MEILENSFVIMCVLRYDDLPLMIRLWHFFPD